MKGLSASFLAIAVLVLPCAGRIAGQTVPPQKPPAKEAIDRALRTAKAERKTVFVEFGASWCTWCRRLDAVLSAEPVHAVIGRNYVVVHLTAQEKPVNAALENPGADSLLLSIGGPNAGLPFYFFLDANGRKLADSNAMPDGTNIGYPASSEEIAAFVGLLKRTAPRLRDAERIAIADSLTARAPK